MDTGQTVCYDDSEEISCPAVGESFYGQDAQYDGSQPSYTDNGDGTVTDNVTGLTWQQSPDTDGDTDIDADDKLTWTQVQTYCDSLDLAGHNDWRLPTIKELQSIVDYTRSPSTSASAAIDPVFNTTSITDEGGDTNYPFYWTGTTHGRAGVYVAFGEALGYMQNQWMDVHGAGAQRSDPKSGDPADYPEGHGPQGDAIRIYNYVRAVRDATATPTPTPPPPPTSTPTPSPTPTPMATPTPTPTPACEPGIDTDGDGFDNDVECYVGTDPQDDCSDGPSHDAWPPDIDRDTEVNVLDILFYKPVLSGLYDARCDLDASGEVDVLDVLLFKPFVNTSRTNP